MIYLLLFLQRRFSPFAAPFIIIIATSLPNAFALPNQPTDPAAYVPKHAPRTTIVAGQQKAFRKYCLQGEGADSFRRIKADFDKDYLAWPFPLEPVTYGDPDPKKRES